MERRTSKRYIAYVIFAILVMMMCWELNKNDAALAQSNIPKESIRLRILANSDSPPDQGVKRQVRDAIVTAMDQWVSGPQTIEQARETVRTHIPELEMLTGETLQSHGLEYAYKVELGVVPFPAKMYGTDVYPAGNYEAVRVTLGKGEGQNWWCVLFPPLCFVDVVSGDAVAAKGKEKAAVVQTKSAAKGHLSKYGGSKTAAGSLKEMGKESKPHFRFFIWDVLCALFHSIFG